MLDLLDLMPDSTPEFMAPAWLSCLMWAVGEKGIMTAYRKETGDTYSPSIIPINKMIDEATGRQEQFVRDFTAWFNANVWGDVDNPKEPNEQAHVS